MGDASLDHISSEDETTSRFSSFECRQGKVEKILTGEPNKRVQGEVIKAFMVQVSFLEGGFADIGYFGHGIDPTTKKLHGSLVPPVVGQQVLVLYPYGNYLQPMGAIPLPYPFYSSDLQREDYHLLNRLDTIEDIEYGHRTGSVLRFRQDGAVEVEHWKSDASAVQSSLKMNADGTIVVTHKDGASINMDADGNVQVVPASGKLVNVGAASPSKGGARLDDQTTMDGSTDPTLFAWWPIFEAGLTAFLTALNPGSLAAQALTFLGIVQANPHPSSHTGKITVASDVVKVE